MIKCFSKSSFLTIVCMAVLCCGMAGNAWAVKDSICFNDVDKPFYTNEVAETKAMKEKKQALKNLLKKMDNFCLQMQKKGLRKEETGLFSESHSSYINKAVANFLKNNPNYKKQYDDLNKQYLEAQQAIEKQRTCDTNPYSCMTKEDKTQNLGTQQEAHSSCVSYHAKLKKCGASFSAADPCGQAAACDSKITENGSCNSADIKAFKQALSQTCSLGKKLYGEKYGTLDMVNRAATVEGDYYAYAPTSGWKDTELAKAYKGSEGEAGLLEELRTLRTNESCHIDALYEDYMGSCYSCVIVSALINTFMQVAEKLAPIMQLAGTRLLIIGIPLWLAFYIIQKLVSLVSLEPMKILNDLFKFFFKCLLAYVLITSGVRAISKLMVNPLLGAGADYGIGIVDSVMPENVSKNVTSKLDKDTKLYKLAASNGVDEKVFDKIMLLSRKADAAVSLNFVIGNALFCHSYNAGAHLLSEKLDKYTGIKLYFPDFWLMLCGVLIWFFAFMLTIGVNFYLLDLSFKIGFALLALPVTLGLWPFEKFKDKFGICIKLIANAAGTFMFLGITTGMSIALISASLGGTDELLNQIKANNQDYVSRAFGLTSGAFILVFFAFFYSHKLISETVSKLADKFFGSVLSGVSPMANKATQMVDMAKKGVTKVAGGLYGATAGKAVNAVKASAKNAALSAGRGAVKGIRKGVRAIRRR